MAQTNNPFRTEQHPPRTQPQQRRAEETIDKVKRAMLELLIEEGYAAASTNRVARRAGVNIASLYRYFPNRSAIALALYEDAAAELARMVHQRLIGRMDLPLRESLREMIATLVEYLDEKQIILMRLSDEVPELRESTQAMALETLARNSSLVYIEHHLGPLDPETRARTLYFVQHFPMGLMRRYISERPPPMPRTAFVDELTLLILRYLQPPAEAATDKAPRKK